ncbi:hypothetical protein LTR53_008844 [Teratosphaeriaceae sp. CCFEE 6253]|nr:hypothetical protein LTR53_008844 [Teratosphaeriaceae sp. CCFEE 6253]
MAEVAKSVAPARSATGSAPGSDENGPVIANMSQTEIDALVAKVGYKKYSDMLEAQIRDDIKKDEKSSLKIRIELNLDVEVHLTARIKGDIVIGLL